MLLASTEGGDNGASFKNRIAGIARTVIIEVYIKR
jgi:hypothetical protein